MAKLNINFDQVEASTGVQPALPSGWQLCIIETSELKPTSNNADTGNELIAISGKVISGPYEGRKLFKTFNYKNANQQAQDIGWGEMKALNEALGTDGEDTDDWHNKPVKVYFKYKAARTLPDKVDPETGVTIPGKSYDEGNDINGFKSADDDSIELNHSVPLKSGGATVNVDPGFKAGGSPVPKVGSTAPAAKAAPKPAAPAKPAAPKAAPVIPKAAPKPAPKEPVFELRMTEAANGLTKEDYVASDPDWTDELLIEHGFAEMVEVEQAEEVEAPAAPAAPKAPGKPAAPAAAGGKNPPWAKK